MAVGLAVGVIAMVGLGVVVVWGGTDVAVGAGELV